MKYLIILLTLVLVSCSSPQQTTTTHPELLRDSVLVIKGFHYNFLAGRTGETEGSAVVIKREGQKTYALTAKHVVDTSTLSPVFVTVGSYAYQQNPYQFYEVEIEETHPTLDLALISFTETVTKARVANISFISPHTGDKIYMVGNPANTNRITITGHVAGRCGEVFECGRDGLGESYIVDKAVPPGISGGGIFSENGDLIGIVISVKVSRFPLRKKIAETISWAIFSSVKEIGRMGPKSRPIWPSQTENPRKRNVRSWRRN